MSPRHLVMFIARSALWGSQFMLVQIALRDLTPVTLSAARASVATAMLGAIILSQRSRRTSAAVLRRRAPRLAVMGAVGIAAPFLLTSYAPRSSTRATVLAAIPRW